MWIQIYTFSKGVFDLEDKNKREISLEYYYLLSIKHTINIGWGYEYDKVLQYLKGSGRRDCHLERKKKRLIITRVK